MPGYINATKDENNTNTSH